MLAHRAFAWLSAALVIAAPASITRADEGSLATNNEGIAARYPGDRNIAEDPHVWCAVDFESDAWHQGWSGGQRETVERVAADDRLRFEPLQGQALRISVPRGEFYGASISYSLDQLPGGEPEEIFFRYYLRFADDWNPRSGGKLPGVSGTYGRGGWGGRPSDGHNGWSARGTFGRFRDGKTPIGFYCYHAAMRGQYGNSWMWEGAADPGLENNRWYCVEQYARMNTPGDHDGILRGWLDGQLVFEKDDIRMRDTDSLKIEQIWMNIYHGGKRPAATDDHLFIDNVVIASRAIGPMRVEAPENGSNEGDN